MKQIKVFHGGTDDELTRDVNDFIKDNEDVMSNIKLSYLQSSPSSCTWITVIVEYDKEGKV